MHSSRKRRRYNYLCILPRQLRGGFADLLHPHLRKTGKISPKRNSAPSSYTSIIRFTMSHKIKSRHNFSPTTQMLQAVFLSWQYHLIHLLCYKYNFQELYQITLSYPFHFPEVLPKHLPLQKRFVHYSVLLRSPIYTHNPTTESFYSLEFPFLHTIPV